MRDRRECECPVCGYPMAQAWTFGSSCECECCGYTGTVREFVGASSEGSCYAPDEERDADYWRAPDPVTEGWT